MLAPLLLALLPAPQEAEEPPTLTVGAPVLDEVRRSDPRTETGHLRVMHAVLPVRAREVRVVVDETGPYTIELRSDHFDGYLVLRGADRSVIAEDDDGCLDFHARLAVELQADTVYHVEACALHGDLGAFELHLRAGFEAEEPYGREQVSAALADARRRVATLEALEPENSPSLATMLNDLAIRLSRIGELEEAQALFETVLSRRTEQFGPEHVLTAGSLNNLALLLYDRARYEQALPLYQRALEINENQLGADDVHTARAATNLGRLLLKMGRYEEASTMLERVLDLVEGQDEDRFLLAACLNNLGLVRLAQGEWGAAREFLEQGLEVFESLDASFDPWEAEGMLSLATILMEQGLDDQALGHLEDAREDLERVRHANHPDIAEGLVLLAKLLHRRGRHDEARQYYERALEIHEEAPGPDHPITAATLEGLARLLVGSFGLHEQALPLASRALAIRERAQGEHHPRTALSLYLLGTAHRDAGRYDEATGFIERALAACEGALADEHPWTLACRNELARLLADASEISAAWRLIRRGDSERTRHLRRILAAQSEQENHIYLAALRWRLELELSLAVEFDRPQARVEAYQSLLSWKGEVGRLFLASTARLRAELTPEQRSFVDDLRTTQTEMSALVFGSVAGEPAQRDERISALREQRNELELELRRTLGPIDEAPPAAFAELAAGLPPDSVALDFFIHRFYRPATSEDGEVRRKGEWTEPHLVAWITRHGSESPSRVDLGLAGRMEAEVRAFLEARIVSADLLAQRGRPATFGLRPEPTAELRKMLWDPLVPHLADARRVFVSPDGFLGTFPFGALQEADGRFALERFAFIHLQDLTALCRPHTAPRRLDTLLSVGGLEYDRVAATTEAAAAGPEPRGAFDARWSRLPHTGDEARAVYDLHAKHFPRAGRRLLLQEAKASEGRLKRELSDHSVLHIATHGFFKPGGVRWMQQDLLDDPGQPRLRGSEAQRVATSHPGLLSGLVCSGANDGAAPGADDGYLTAEEVGWLDLSAAELVVLSACNTALGDPRSGEGLIGLRRAFRQAGARTVISSLWAVDDESTRELMSSFYRNLWQEGMGTLEALRTAQLEMIERDRSDVGPQLSTWAAFVLDGAP